MAIELPEGRSESNDVRDALRLPAVHARRLGYAVVEIAAILGAREETASRWCSRYDRGGQEALPGDRTGRPIGPGRRPDKEQEQSLPQTIETEVPHELGIASASWARQAVRGLIPHQVGIRLPIRTVGEYRRRWGVTPQEPVRKASEQDPQAVAEWLEKTYPEIERRAAQGGGEIHWGDETGVRSTCQHSRGYARPGEAPELAVPGGRSSVAMISTITDRGGVRWMISTGEMNAALFIVSLTRPLAGATKEVFLTVDHLSVRRRRWSSGWRTRRIGSRSSPCRSPRRSGIRTST